MADTVIGDVVSNGQATVTPPVDQPSADIAPSPDPAPGVPGTAVDANGNVMHPIADASLLPAYLR